MLAPFLAAVGISGTASAGTSNGNTKPYSITITPLYNGAAQASPGAGETTSFSVEIVNEDSQQTLGSLDIYLGPVLGYGLPDVSATPVTLTGYQTSPTSPVPTFDVSGGVVEVRGLSLPAGSEVSASFTITTAYAPCVDLTVDPAKLIVAKQANDFSGNPGNNFTLDTSQSTVGAFVTGSCGLTFITHPAQAQVDTPISDTDFTPPGTNGAGPIQVQIVDAANNAIDAANPSASSSVTAGLDQVPFVGQQTVPAVGGIASFNDLVAGAATASAVDQLEAIGTATLPNGGGSQALTPGFSSLFQVWGAGTLCTQGNSQCSPANPVVTNDVSATESGNTSSGTSTTTPAEIGISQNTTKISCGDRYYHAGTPTMPVYTTAESVGSLTGTVVETITIGSAVVQGPAAQYEVCFQDANLTFDVLGGGTSNGGPALLATCKESSGTQYPLPCVNSITKSKHGITETLWLPANDPHTSF